MLKYRFKKLHEILKVLQTLDQEKTGFNLIEHAPHPDFFCRYYSSCDHFILLLFLCLFILMSPKKSRLQNLRTEKIVVGGS